MKLKKFLDRNRLKLTIDKFIDRKVIDDYMLTIQNNKDRDFGVYRSVWGNNIRNILKRFRIYIKSVEEITSHSCNINVSNIDNVKIIDKFVLEIYMKSL